jgi:hypothetical protein
MGEVYQGGNSENRIKTEKYLFLFFRKEGDRSRTGTGDFSAIWEPWDS